MFLNGPPLLFLAAALFLAAFFLALLHARRHAADRTTHQLQPLGPPAIGAVTLATLLAAALLLYRAAAARSLTLPLSYHLDAFLLLALLLDAALAYLRLTRRFASFALLLLPVIAALLLLGGILALTTPGPYRYENIWTLLHVLSVSAGTLCFALACAGGAVYLLAHRQLKTAGNAGHRPAWLRGLPPLAAIERFNLAMVYAGFPLLTLAMVTGFLRLAQATDAPHTPTWRLVPKLLLASAAWLTYALLAHAPLAPRLRGRYAAWLSILGFALFLATYAAVVGM